MCHVEELLPGEGGEQGQLGGQEGGHGGGGGGQGGEERHYGPGGVTPHLECYLVYWTGEVQSLNRYKVYSSQF